MDDLKVISGGTIYTPREKIENGAIVIVDQTIAGIGRANDLTLPSAALHIDATGMAIVPGLIDIHTYGCLGIQLTVPQRAAIELGELAKNVARFGVTGFLVSVPMGTPEFITEMLHTVAKAIPKLSGGANCLGIHLEGPYLDPAQRGAFPVPVLREPDVHELGNWAEAAEGYLRIVTLAPNLPNANACAKMLRDRKIVASLGHSSAGYDQAHQALAPNGDFTLATHIFNAMTGLHHRNPGVVGAVLASNIPAMLICDGEHVHPSVVKIITRAKSTERVILVTDAIAGAGTVEGVFNLFDQPVYVNGNRAVLANGTLAGSVLTLNRAVINAREFAGISFGDALKMATANPARLLGLENSGMLSVGADATLALMDEESAKVKLTIVKGEIVFASD